jgi:hypothetical protein
MAAAVAVLMAVVMAAAANVALTVFTELYFFHAVALGTRDLVSMLAAFGARLDFPDMTAVLAFKLPVFNHIRSSLDDDGMPLDQRTGNLCSRRPEHPLQSSPGYSHGFRALRLIHAAQVLQPDGFQFFNQ